jgi:hypothetical protein
VRGSFEPGRSHFEVLWQDRHVPTLERQRSGVPPHRIHVIEEVILRPAPALLPIRSLEIGCQIRPVSPLKPSDCLAMDPDTSGARSKGKAKLSHHALDILTQFSHQFSPPRQ